MYRVVAIAPELGTDQSTDSELNKEVAIVVGYCWSVWFQVGFQS